MSRKKPSEGGGIGKGLAEMTKVILTVAAIAAVIMITIAGLNSLKHRIGEAIEEAGGNKQDVSDISIDYQGAMEEVWGKISSKDESEESEETPSSSVSSSGEESSIEEGEPQSQDPLPEGDYIKVTFLDVGQGDATLIECEGEYMLIDGGYPEYGDVVVERLKTEGVKRLKYLVATHAHADHVGGLSEVMEAFMIDHVLAPVTSDAENISFQIFAENVAANGLRIEVPTAGDTFTLGGANISLLGPLSDPSSVEDVNNTSLVMKLTYKDVSFLFQGDASYDEEQEILNSGADLKVDVLKVGHHGSSSSTGYQWLYFIEPTYGVISCGEKNEYWHPHEKVLSRLRDAEVTLFRTDLQGTIVCISDGKEIEFRTDKSATTEELWTPGTYID